MQEGVAMKAEELVQVERELVAGWVRQGKEWVAAGASAADSQVQIWSQESWALVFWRLNLEPPY